MTTRHLIWDLVETPSISGLIQAASYFLGYLICLFLAAKYLPSIEAKSPKKTYQLTGLLTFISLTILILIGYFTQLISLLFIIEKFISFFIIINLFAILFSLYLFKRSEADGNPTGLIDFWHGREKDPLLFGVDLKVFFYQPSLFALALVNVSFLEAQFRLYDTLTAGMIFYQIFWFIYLLTHYLRENFMLWTFDIIEDHFGFMLVWGDLIYVPFLYSICGWFVAENVHEILSITWLITLCIIHFIGHYTFREANWQKFDFRQYGPQVKIWGKKVELLEGRLLISGFWGIGRHLNYTGEILVYLSIALCTGTISWIPYILPFSLFILLSQRSIRDDQRCRKKYGNILWNKYCQIAKFKMIPFIY